MAKKWLDSIEKQRRRIDLKERYKQTDKQAGRRLDSAPVSDVDFCSNFGESILGVRGPKSKIEEEQRFVEGATEN